jgi:hypothetical protein
METEFDKDLELLRVKNNLLFAVTNYLTTSPPVELCFILDILELLQKKYISSDKDFSDVCERLTRCIKKNFLYIDVRSHFYKYNNVDRLTELLHYISIK